VQKDAGADAGLGGGIVSDENSPFVEIVGPPHLFGAAPIDSSDFRTIDKLIVITRAGIIDSLGRFGERDVMEFDPTRTPRGCVAERRAEAKNSRGHFVVAFDLAWAGVAFRIDQPQAPAEPILSHYDGNRVPPRFPITGCTRPLEELENAGRRTPIRCHDQNTLPRITQRIGCSRRCHWNHQEKK